MMLYRSSIAIVLLSLNVASCGYKESDQPQGMLKENLNCPNGSLGEYNVWGGVDSPGWVHNCKMNHGSYHVWKNDILVIEGQFNFGKKDGVWTYRDDNGVVKTITYKNGKEQITSE
jgi:antitoxin component YwqK of YwqJK toxin-antitoxin module